MFEYLVVSYNPHYDNDQYYVGFENEQDAREFLDTEQHGFRIREMYNCENGLPEDFLNDWCYTENEEEAESNGYYWDENLQEFTNLMHFE